jgi:hypothetical protein
MLLYSIQHLLLRANADGGVAPYMQTGAPFQLWRCQSVNE